MVFATGTKAPVGVQDASSLCETVRTFVSRAVLLGAKKSQKYKLGLTDSYSDACAEVLIT